MQTTENWAAEKTGTVQNILNSCLDSLSMEDKSENDAQIWSKRDASVWKVQGYCAGNKIEKTFNLVFTKDVNTKENNKVPN